MNVDYNKLAKSYDSHRGGGGPYLDVLVDLAQNNNAQRILEVGAGTGNNTAAFAEAYPSAPTALEPAHGMLTKGVAKGLPARWLQGSAKALPFAESSFDFIFGCYVLHYLGSLRDAFAECARVLGNGAAAFVTAPIDFIQRHPMNAYFPSFAKVDTGRFHSLDFIQDAFESVGFRAFESRRLAAEPRPIDEAFVERVANKFISTYLLIPDDEFESGLARLRADVAAKGQLEVPLIWESLTVWAYVRK